MKLNQILEKALTENTLEPITKLYFKLTGLWIEPKQKEVSIGDLEFDIEGKEGENKEKTEEKEVEISYTKIPPEQIKTRENYDDEKHEVIQTPDFATAIKIDGCISQTKKTRLQEIRKRIGWVDDKTLCISDEHPFIHDDKPPRPRDRPKSSKVEVFCKLCGKKELVSKTEAVRYNKDPELNSYKCDSCILSNRPVKD